MPNDPGLAPDTCIYMEAITGDGGVHNGNDTWWLSPDIKLTGHSSGLDNADPGQDNSVEVRLHRKAADSGCTSPFSESVTVELWVGNPALAMTPNNPASTKNVENIGTPMPAEGATATQPIVWHPPTGLDPSNPQSPGHKCLIARCYPDSLTPDSEEFFVPDDPHVAQHNICIVPCDGPGAGQRRGECRFKLSTANPSRKFAERVTLRAVVDLHPSRFVERVLSERLKRTPGFERLATAAPRSFRLELPDFPDAQVIDDTRPGCLALLFGGKGQHILDAKIQLDAGQFTNFTFVADMSRAKSGDAYIFHLRQIGGDGRDQGGLTLVMVAV